jgi:hypothetical protein
MVGQLPERVARETSLENKFPLRRTEDIACGFACCTNVAVFLVTAAPPPCAQRS